MTPTEARELVDSLAFVDCHPRYVPQETILRAMLAQSGHYVAHEIVELYQHFGIAPVDGYAITLDVGPWKTASGRPRGIAYRFSGDWSERHGRWRDRCSPPTVLFWPESHRYIDPGKEERAAAKRDPSILEPISVACRRWGVVESDRPYPYLYYPWGSSHRTHLEDGRSDPYTTALRHVDLYTSGSICGAIAFAAGLLEMSGNIPFAITPTRWMFDLEPPKV